MPSNITAQEEFLQQRAKLPIYQLYGLLGLNPYEKQLEQFHMSQGRQALGEADQGLNALLEQLKKGKGDLFSLATNLSLGQGANALRATAGMGGIAGSGLQALGASQLTSSVLAQLARDIANNRLQRNQLMGSLYGARGNLALGGLGINLKQQSQDSSDNSMLPELLFGITKKIFKGAL